MSDKMKRLGKGLEALIPKSALTSGRTLTNIPLTEIRPNPLQPRTEFDVEKLKALADSISKHGLAQPILVRKKDNYYELITGERRYRASLLANMNFIPAIVKNVSDRDSLQLTLIENLQRADLNPVEEADGYKNLVDSFNMTHQEIADSIGKSRSAVTNCLRLLNLPVIVQDAISANIITGGHARTLLALQEEKDIIAEFNNILAGNLNVRQVEEMVADKKNVRGMSKAKKHRQLSLFSALEKELTAQYKTRVEINGSEKKGRIIIKYTSSKQFADIKDRLQH
ncbi:MAG: ParB/RepB/Spo0J family partition protein [bacterium]|nr:ParB/RepB/Spo0J family partition protein [bacterium]